MKINKVANIIIPVNDQESVLAFYVEKLNFEKRADMPFGPGLRWIEIAPAGADTTVAICPPGPGVTAGNKQTGITFESADVEALHAELKEKGIDVDPEVSRFGENVPPIFWFRDIEGNILSVSEKN